MTGKLAMLKNISPKNISQGHLADLLPSRGAHHHWLRPLASRLILQ
jgi:hypothetical protein